MLNFKNEKNVILFSSQPGLTVKGAEDEDIVVKP
jgi:hypothetical protein